MERKFKKRHKSRAPEVPPTKQEMEIMKYIRFKTPKKSTVMEKQDVEYFIGSKAVDVLMDSKWSREIRNTDFLFPTREQATKFLNDQLQKRFFYRAMKNEKEVTKKKTEETKDQSGDNQDKSDSKVRKRKKAKAVEEGGNDPPEVEENNKKQENKDKATKEKIKKRYKLTIHDEQKFRDSKDIYIWIYSPIHPKTVLLGLVVLLGVIAATLFPLWPPVVRIGVYYLSLAGGVFIGSIFAIAFARSVLFAAIWMCTFGKHSFWILPNILADVGFFDSFKPWYTHECKGDSKEKKDDDVITEDDKDVAKAEDQEEEKLEEDNYNEDYEVLGETDEKTATENSATEGEEVSSSDPTAIQ